MRWAYGGIGNINHERTACADTMAVTRKESVGLVIGKRFLSSSMSTLLLIAMASIVTSHSAVANELVRGQ